MNKLNDEELSRVLSAHASGELGGVRGIHEPYNESSRLGCLIQVARADSNVTINDNTNWYDQNRFTLKTLSVDSLLEQLEFVGIA